MYISGKPAKDIYIYKCGENTGAPERAGSVRFARVYKTVVAAAAAAVGRTGTGRNVTGGGAPRTCGLNVGARGCAGGVTR